MGGASGGSDSPQSSRNNIPDLMRATPVIVSVNMEMKTYIVLVIFNQRVTRGIRRKPPLRLNTSLCSSQADTDCEWKARKRQRIVSQLNRVHVHNMLSFTVLVSLSGSRAYGDPTMHQKGRGRDFKHSKH